MILAGEFERVKVIDRCLKAKLFNEDPVCQSYSNKLYITETFERGRDKKQMSYVLINIFCATNKNIYIVNNDKRKKNKYIGTIHCYIN